MERRGLHWQRAPVINNRYREPRSCPALIRRIESNDTPALVNLLPQSVTRSDLFKERMHVSIRCLSLLPSLFPRFIRLLSDSRKSERSG